MWKNTKAKAETLKAGSVIRSFNLKLTGCSRSETFIFAIFIRWNLQLMMSLGQSRSRFFCTTTFLGRVNQKLNARRNAPHTPLTYSHEIDSILVYFVPLPPWTLHFSNTFWLGLPNKTPSRLCSYFAQNKRLTECFNQISHFPYVVRALTVTEGRSTVIQV